MAKIGQPNALKVFGGREQARQKSAEITIVLAIITLLRNCTFQ